MTMTTIERKLLVALVMSLAAVSVSAQRIIGSGWDGVVVSANETTREITLSNLRGDKKQTFVGVLEPGYMQKLRDGTYRELQMSEFKPGLRIRVFYKEKSQEVSGKKVKVKMIHRIEFLGRDQFTMIREILGLPPSTPVARADPDKLPPANPLKVYTSFQQPEVEKRFRNWVERWNKEDGKKYGMIEFVDQLAKSDVSVVFFWGFDESPYAFTFQMYDPRGNPHAISQATVQFVTIDNEGLKFLWHERTFATADAPGEKGLIEKEFEKRMKARK